MKSRIILLGVIVALLSSCAGKFSVIKRRYNKGFYVAAANGHNKNKHQAQPEQTRYKAQQETNEDKIVTQVVSESRATVFTRTDEPAQKPEKKLTATTARKLLHTAKTVEFKPLQENLKSIQQEREHSRAGADADTNTILLIILAIFIPPLAVYLKDKAVSKWFWIVLILSIIGGILWFAFPFAGLAWLLAVIFAILYILGQIS